ncbi:MAG: murein L,D-transpeptidase family protein [Candidatus Tectimicrobiota bacterium]
MRRVASDVAAGKEQTRSVRRGRAWRCLRVLGLGLLLTGCAGVQPEEPMPAGARRVDDVMSLYGAPVEQRLRPYFEAAALAYPPTALALLGFKEEKRLEVWAQQAGPWVLLRVYPILAASGGAGPKLREGDLQVPEGIYRIEALNPNSQFHLSMKLDYPNARDREQAAREGRQQLGGDIFLHGRDVSVGCIALGDAAIEELFVLVVRVGLEHVTVLLAPRDLRQSRMGHGAGGPSWVEALYDDLRHALRPFTGPAPAF